MLVKIRLPNGTCETTNVSKLTKISDLKTQLEKELNVNTEQQRLYYGGKELEGEYTIFHYRINLGDVILLVLKPDPSSPTTSKLKEDTPSTLSTKEKATEAKDESGSSLSLYWNVGQHILARDKLRGCWGDAKITHIAEQKTVISTDSASCSTDSSVKTASASEAGSLNDNSNCSKDNLEYTVKFDTVENSEEQVVLLEDTLPPPIHTYTISELKEDMVVLANLNLESSNKVGLWYAFELNKIKVNRTTTDISGLVLMGSNSAVKIQAKLKYKYSTKKIEKLLPKSELSKPVETGILVDPCIKCCDDPNKPCTDCSCIKCGGKENPETQILCDECNDAFHLACLSPPLTEMPEDEEWYCPGCKRNTSEIVKPGTELKSKRTLKETSTKRDWGRGNACLGRTKVNTLVSKNHYGPIPGILVGTTYMYRRQASEAGVHLPPVSGIHGRATDGAYSLVLSGGYEDDLDNGEEFFYTGSGGRDLSGNKRVSIQSFDQEFTLSNRALALNCDAPLKEEGAEAKDWKKGKPIRVLRNYKLKKHSKYAPEQGNRYDGIYKVVKYWKEKGKSGFLVCRYLLRRDDKEPAPWTPKGKKYVKDNGLDVIIDDIVTGKRPSSSAENESPNKKARVVAYTLEDEIDLLVSKDSSNSKVWEGLKASLVEGKVAFLEKVSEAFTCVCCQEITVEAVTTPCFHNMCKDCMRRSFAASVYSCPMCRSDLGKEFPMEVNNCLTEALKLLFPGYSSGR